MNKINKVKEEEKNFKVPRIIVVFGSISLFLGILSIIIKIIKISKEQIELSKLEQIIPGLILIILGYYLIQFGKNYNKKFKYIGVLSITICSFFLSSSIILHSFSVEIPQISKNIQPTLDSIIIEHISLQEGQEYEILQDLLNTTVSFQTLNAKSLTKEQNQFLIESFEINKIPDLTADEKKDLPAKIISTIYESLLQQNQEDILRSPIPITQIITFLKSSGNMELTLITMSYLYDINNEAELIIMIPEKKQLNSSAKNLEHIRNECKSLEKNKVCEAFELSEYNNLMQYISQSNSSLPIEINLSKIENYNSIEKLEDEINSQTEKTKKIFFFSSIFFFLLGYFFIEKHYSHRNGKTLLTIKKINSKMLSYILFPTCTLIIIYFFLQSTILANILDLFLKNKSQDISKTILEMPIFENFLFIIKNILIYHVILIVLFLILLYIINRQIKRKIVNTHS